MLLLTAIAAKTLLLTQMFASESLETTLNSGPLSTRLTYSRLEVTMMGLHLLVVAPHRAETARPETLRLNHISLVTTCFLRTLLFQDYISKSTRYNMCIYFTKNPLLETHILYNVQDVQGGSVGFSLFAIAFTPFTSSKDDGIASQRAKDFFFDW